MKMRKILKEVLKEIRFDRETGKWVRLDEGGHKAGCTCGFCKNKGTFGKKKKAEKDDDKKDEKGDKKEDKKKSNKNPFAKKKDEVDETVDMKMGPSYKTVQPRQYKVMDDDFARTNQYDPEITEMFDDEEECMMNERYVDLANSKRNLSEAELSELKTLREKIDKMALAKRNFGLSQGGVEPNIFEGRCEDFPCCGHEPGDCPDSQGRFTCVGCGRRLPRNAPSSICPKCQRNRFNREEDPTGQDDDFQENVDMKMGPSYKTVQPTLAKTADDDFARTNQYDPQVQENQQYCSQCGENPVSAGKDLCNHCDYDVHHHQSANDASDVDDHDIYREPVSSNPDDPTLHLRNEAGGGAVQHSSYRTVGSTKDPHGNLPQSGKQRWADDLDEGKKKPSKVSKAIAKGQKPKKTQKNPHLKFQQPKKTHSGVHKRKT
jgi:hypothetical protein